MLATKPAETGTTAGTTSGAMPPYNLAAATTAMMWACALATARVTVASTARGLALWSHMLRVPADGLRERAAEAEPAPQAAGTSAAPRPEEPAAIAPTPANATPFASYRSSGGHAAAQVTVSD
jgi:hypothetical protein